MDAINLAAESRETGKKASRAVRRSGHVPCVLYSRDTDPVSFQVPALPLKRIAFSRSASLVNIQMDGQSWECILKDFDLDPVTDEPLHADFQVLQSGERINLTVPIHYHGTPFGQTEGGDTQYIMHEIAISCLPQDIPAYIDVDVSDLDIGESIHVYDIQEEGVEFEAAAEQTLVTVVAPYVEPTTAEEEISELELTEEGEIVDTAEGEEGVEGEAEAGEGEEDFEEDL